MIKESDWKRFSRLKETALDRYCERALADCRATMEQEDRSNHERFLDLYQHLHEADKRLDSSSMATPARRRSISSHACGAKG